MDILTYALSKKYTDDTTIGLGIQRGKNCKIKSIDYANPTNTKVTFEWTKDDNTSVTSEMNVPSGKGVKSIYITNNHLITVMTDNTEIDCGELDVDRYHGYYTSKIKKSNYLYEMEYNELDYDYAYSYFKTDEDEIIGGCSSFRYGNYFARNYDWLYDNTVEFLVHTAKTKTRYGVVGVASGLKDLNKDFVSSGAFSELYKLVPFVLLDGINSEGLVVSMNVVPTDYGKNKTEPTSDLMDEVCSKMLPRYLLDRFSNATEAVNFIQQHLSIYFTKTLHNMDYEVHYLISDKSGKNYVVEFKDNQTVILEDKNIITNFHLLGVHFNNDGSVFTPSTQTQVYNAYDTNKITLHGSGLERYNLINSMATDSKMNLIQLLQDLRYTNTYTQKQWLTEFVGNSSNLTVKSDEYDFNEIISIAESYYNTRDRDNPITWHTVHSSLYDFENLSLELRIQESPLPIFNANSVENDMDNIQSIVLNTDFNNANDCVPDGTTVEVYRVGNNALNIPINQSGIIETFVYRDNGNVRITQRYTVNYNTNGNPTFVRTGIGTDGNITWNSWSTYERYSTDEIIIGQWTDGKTLYRKVVNGTSSFSNDKWTNVTISSDNTSKSIKNWSVCIPQSSLRMESFDVTNIVKLSTVANQGYGSTVTNQPFTLILEYTK